MAAEDIDSGQQARVAIAEQPHPFEELYRQPTIPAMYALSAGDFERFVKHVLTHAGYDVRHTGPFFKRGVDLELHSNQAKPRRRLGAVECKNYNRKLPVGRDPVQKLAGAAALKGGLPGYLITTSDFTGPAKEEAQIRPHLTILRRGGRALQGRGQRPLLSLCGTLLVGLGTPVRRRETVRPSVPSHPTWVAFRQETICCRGPRARDMLLARKGIPRWVRTGHLSDGPVAAASAAQDVSVGEAKAAPPGG